MATSRIQQLFDFLKGDPTDAFTLYSLAYEFLKEGHIQKAIEYFSTLRQHHPDYVGLYYHLGKAYQTLELYDKAEEAFQVGIEIAKEKEDAHSLEELNRAVQQLNDELLY